MKIRQLLISAAFVLCAAVVPVTRYQQVQHKWSNQQVEQLRDTVTEIGVFLQNGQGVGGAGVMIREDGLTLTAAHLFNNGPISEVLMRTRSGNVYQMRPIAIDIKHDLALIRPHASAQQFKYSDVSRSNKLYLNDDVLVIGHPYNISYDAQRGVILGVVADDFYGCETIQTSALVRPGNSGGPMFNINGNVIGIVSASQHDIFGEYYQGIAISIRQIREFIRATEEKEWYWPKQIKRYRIGE